MAEKVLEEIMADNSSSLVRDIHLQIKEVEQISNKTNPRNYAKTQNN